MNSDPPSGSGSKRGRDDGDDNDQPPEKRIMSYVSRMVDPNNPDVAREEGLVSDIGDKILEYDKLERLAEACMRKIQVRANFEPYSCGGDYEEEPPIWTIRSFDVTLPEEISSFFSNLGGRTFTLQVVDLDAMVDYNYELTNPDISFVADTSRLKLIDDVHSDDHDRYVLYEGNLGKFTLTPMYGEGHWVIHFQFPNRYEDMSIELTSDALEIKFSTYRESSHAHRFY